VPTEFTVTLLVLNPPFRTTKVALPVVGPKVTFPDAVRAPEIVALAALRAPEIVADAHERALAVAVIAPDVTVRPAAKVARPDA